MRKAGRALRALFSFGAPATVGAGSAHPAPRADRRVDGQWFVVMARSPRRALPHPDLSLNLGGDAVAPSATRGGRVLVASLSAMMLAACASNTPKPSPDNILAKAFVKPAPGSLIVLLPTEAPAQAEKGARLLTHHLAGQLAATGYRVATVGRENLSDLWKLHGESVGGLYDPITGAAKPDALAEARAAVIRNICADAGCALVVQPRLVLRLAQLKGSQAEWDGVRLPIPFTAGSARDYNSKGSVHAYSAQLTGRTASGEFAFRTQGGAALVHAVNIRHTKSERREDPFEVESDMARAATLTLAPLAGP